MRAGDKFKDYYVHFKSTRTGTRTRDKFKNRQRNLLKKKYTSNPEISYANSVYIMA